MRVYLCEKPSQGKDIARVLGASQRGAGCVRGAGVIVTWCIGHLVEAVPPEGYDARYKRWSLDDLPIIPTHWRVAPKAATATQFRVVKQLVGEADDLVIATDADREGELIAREILDLCGYRGPIQRLWLSALNDASIRRALGALKPSSDTVRLAVLYSWIKALHVAAPLVFVAGVLATSAFLRFNKGEPQQVAANAAAFRRWDRGVTIPAMLLVWALGIELAMTGHWTGAGWLVVKACLVVVLSALHGMQVGKLRRLSLGLDASVARAP